MTVLAAGLHRMDWYMHTPYEEAGRTKSAAAQRHRSPRHAITDATACSTVTCETLATPHSCLAWGGVVLCQSR